MNPSCPSAAPRVAIVGGGPAGLMAAEVLAAGGMRVDLFDAMPSVGRKFLLAGKGGLNLTHSEPLEPFLDRFGARRAALEPLLRAFGPAELRAWARGLGIDTFVGSSGRVFPTDLKAAPLLRAWLHRLREAGVRFHMRHRWLGWAEGGNAHALRFAAPQGEVAIDADAVVLALGGGSWARLGSDGAWVPLLAARGVDVAPLQPSNCGFAVGRAGDGGALMPGWSEFFRTRFAGQPLKNVALSMRAADGSAFDQPGEFVITAGGVEGSLVYALSGPARDAIATNGRTLVHIDLLPQRSADFVRDEVARPRGSRSLSTHLKSRLGLDGVKAALLHEVLRRDVIADPARLAAAIKSVPLILTAARPIDEAISSAGGVRFEALDDGLMLRALPGVFCAGEMLDWEAPTGGYLLTASIASGVVAARAVLRRRAG
ncbi:MAG: TIGR03862 family flavoprotein [Pseudomonadota bacterium]